jgi:hypothetical protein
MTLDARSRAASTFVILLLFLPNVAAAECMIIGRQIAKLEVQSCSPSLGTVLRAITLENYSENSLSSLVKSSEQVSIVSAKNLGEPEISRKDLQEILETRHGFPTFLDESVTKFIVVGYSVEECEREFANSTIPVFVQPWLFECCHDVGPPPDGDPLAQCVLGIPSIERIPSK